MKAFRTPIPSSLYADVVIRRDVLAIWKNTGVPQLMGCNRVADAIANVSKWLCNKAKEDRYQLKTKILSTKRAVVSLQHFQQRMPWVTWVMSELNNTMDKQRMPWVQSSYNSFAAKWAQAGDEVSYDFFQIVKEKKSCNGMK